MLVITISIQKMNMEKFTISKRILIKNKDGKMLSLVYYPKNQHKTCLLEPNIGLAINELTVKKVTKFPFNLHSFFQYTVVLHPKLEINHEKWMIVKLIANQDH